MILRQPRSTRTTPLFTYTTLFRTQPRANIMTLLGCIADDLTGATDLALMLAREGMRTVQVNGLTENNMLVPEVDALVVALKSRTVPRSEEHTSELQSLMRISYAGYCLTNKQQSNTNVTYEKL